MHCRVLHRDLAGERQLARELGACRFVERLVGTAIVDHLTVLEGRKPMSSAGSGRGHVAGVVRVTVVGAPAAGGRRRDGFDVRGRIRGDDTATASGRLSVVDGPADRVDAEHDRERGNDGDEDFDDG